jgi:hypothetical protein
VYSVGIVIERANDPGAFRKARVLSEGKTAWELHMRKILTAAVSGGALAVPGLATAQMVSGAGGGTAGGVGVDGPDGDGNYAVQNLPSQRLAFTQPFRRRTGSSRPATSRATRAALRRPQFPLTGFEPDQILLGRMLDKGDSAMRIRARARLSGAVALVAASALGGGAALAQTTATTPMLTNLPSQRLAAGTEPNAAATGTSGGQQSAGTTGTNPGAQQNAAAPAGGTSAGGGTSGAQQSAGANPTSPGGEQNAAAAPAGSTGASSGTSGSQQCAGTTGTNPGGGTSGAQQSAGANATSPGGEQNTAAAPAATPAPTTPEIRVEELRAFVGKDVLGPNGNVLGTLDNVTTNSSGQPEQLVLSRGGFLGLFQSQYRVNWTTAKPKVENGKLVFALTPQELTPTANK